MVELTVATLGHNHTLYLHSSDTPGVALIAIKLTGPENYGLWSLSMKLALLYLHGRISWPMGEMQRCSFVVDKKHTSLKQGNDFVTEYYFKMRDLWNDFDVLVLFPSCHCTEAKAYTDHLHQQRLLMFLMGLNEIFSHVRSDILLKAEAPSVNQAYATIVQEESQRLLGVVESGKEPLTMMTGKGHNFNSKGGKKSFT
ncbi:hypothetical protein R3W88_002312 [Solanum pinnatisectum]|uniref:Retrotransposon Copia-like N-terminal domain-containing protein n=1 Tax=Solanum pinnatisectum TaxID=50273 RepID=A0AAV9MNG2_9SOLN|nr:hypothetical protein R3W88_002312 [Solanum pinnatisectum]